MEVETPRDFPEGLKLPEENCLPSECASMMMRKNLGESPGQPFSDGSNGLVLEGTEIPGIFPGVDVTERKSQLPDRECQTKEAGPRDFPG
jgi:hypothetical protein